MVLMKFYQEDEVAQDRGGRFRSGGWKRGGRGRFNNEFNKTSDNYMNPVGADGNVRRCFECDSKKHLVEKCPHRRRKEEANVAVHITLLGSDGILSDTFGYGLLDSGCTKTFAGEIWLNEYLFTLGEEERKLVQTRKSQAVFRFRVGWSALAIDV